ncbi:MAG: hypothetical protein N2201_01465 [candidate division WOR-3 bacterium]|nr:hypothetical protein [candidate division WOR-3 bacterium]
MTRIIVWTIVGILVVVAIIFTVTSRRQQRQMIGVLPVKGEAYDAFISRSEKDLARLTQRSEDVKAKLTAPSPEQQAMLTELDAKLNELSAIVSSLKEKEDRKEREDAVIQIRELKRNIRRLIRDLGGRVAPETETEK